MAFYDLKRGLLLGLWLAVAACEDIDPGVSVEAGPDAEKPPAKDAGKDAGRDLGKDAGRDAGAKPANHDASAVRPEDAGTTPADSGATACTPFVMPTGVDCSAPADGVLPKDLRCTGLYGKFEQRELACGIIEYKPAYQLWSDAAEKRRFVSLPAGKKIDASDPDAFVFPVGTLFWKEFRVKGSNGQARMAETRLLKKSADGWLYSSYVWSEDEKSAIQMNNATGVPNLYGTGHTVPTRDQCNECHIGRSDAILGWDALLLGPGAEGMTREMLADLDLIEPGAQLDLAIPGNDLERAALGYLHTNCGVSCHNELQTSKARETGMYLRLEKAELGSVAATDAVRSSINKVPGPNAKLGGLPTITGTWVGIRPGDPTRSLLVARQKLRGPEGQMPRIATNKVDETGVKLTSDWIQSMTPDAGYPAPAK